MPGLVRARRIRKNNVTRGQCVLCAVFMCRSIIIQWYNYSLSPPSPWIHPHTYTPTHTHTHTHTLMHSHTHTHALTHIHIPTPYTYTHRHTHTCRPIHKHTCTYSHIPAVYSAIGTSHMFVLPLLCSCYPVSVSDKWHCGYAMGKGVMRVFKCVWRGFRWSTLCIILVLNFENNLN